MLPTYKHIHVARFHLFLCLARPVLTCALDNLAAPCMDCAHRPQRDMGSMPHHHLSCRYKKGFCNHLHQSIKMKRATEEEDTTHRGLAKGLETAMQEPPPMTNEMHHCLQKVSSRVDNLDQRMQALETNMDKIEWDMKSTITCRCLT